MRQRVNPLPLLERGFTRWRIEYVAGSTTRRMPVDL
jgi:hypothetical protein